MPGSQLRIVLIGSSDSALKKLADQLEAAGFPTTKQSLTQKTLMDKSASVAIFLPQVPKEPRNKLANALRASNPSLKIVMLYVDKISGTEVADAVINAGSDFDDLVRTLTYMTERPARRSAKRA